MQDGDVLLFKLTSDLTRSAHAGCERPTECRAAPCFADSSSMSRAKGIAYDSFSPEGKSR